MLKLEEVGKLEVNKINHFDKFQDEVDKDEEERDFRGREKNNRGRGRGRERNNYN